VGSQVPVERFFILSPDCHLWAASFYFQFTDQTCKSRWNFNVGGWLKKSGIL